MNRRDRGQWVGGARQGLTLLELLVVLFLLALLATLAVQTTEGMVQQGRFDATRRTLDQVERSVLGPLATEQNPGEPAVSFLADMGRLPLAAGDDPALQLSELWIPPADPAQLFAVRQSTDGDHADADVRLGAGWRGPYLRLPVGETRLLDGWGNAFAIFQTDGITPAMTGDAIGLVTSAGSDNVLGGVSADAYAVDLGLVRPFVPANVASQVIGAVEDAAPTTLPSGAAQVILFEPVPISAAHPDGIREVVEDLEWNGSSLDTNFAFSGLVLGPKALRVVQGTRKGSVIYINVPAGGMQLNLKFDLQ